MEKFNCDKCGNCCRYVKKVLELKDSYSEQYKELINEFPYSFKDNGECEKLVDNLCLVYNDRPDICNVERVYNKIDSKLSLKEYYEVNKKCCNSIKLLIKE